MENLETKLTIAGLILLSATFVWVKHLTSSIGMNGDTYVIAGFMVYPDTNEKLYIPVYRRK